MNPPTTPESRPWYVRPYRSEDEAALLELYRLVNGRTRPAAELRWKLLSRTADFPTVYVAVTRDESTIVGHYAGIPILLQIGGRELPALHTVEAMTHPDFRRQGILTAVVETTHAAWTQAGQAFVIGLPNEQWGSRAYALGYRPLFPLAWLRLPLRLDKAIAGRAGLNVALGTTITSPLRAASWAWRALHDRGRSPGSVVTLPTDTGTADLDTLWSRVAPSWRNAVVRGGDHVAWRYLRAQPTPYQILVAGDEAGVAGYIAYRAVETGPRLNGVIADLCAARGDDNTIFALLRAACDDLREQGAGTAATLAPPGSRLYRALRRAGFLPRRRSTEFSFEMVALHHSYSLEGLGSPADWLLTGGDFDIL